ncbi:MAG: hypothetical protein PHG19_01680 [Anaerotignum sp.]|nr:hypothetical protein [Anaerotignum sp.]
MEMKSSGMTNREIGEKFGFTINQLTNFTTRYNTNQRKLKAGIALKKKGRTVKDCDIIETNKVNELKYIISRKEAKIKQLETEHELMRDLLSFAERR